MRDMVHVHTQQNTQCLMLTSFSRGEGKAQPLLVYGRYRCDVSVMLGHPLRMTAQIQAIRDCLMTTSILPALCVSPSSLRLASPRLGPGTSVPPPSPARPFRGSACASSRASRRGTPTPQRRCASIQRGEPRRLDGTGAGAEGGGGVAGCHPRNPTPKRLGVTGWGWGWR